MRSGLWSVHAATLLFGLAGLFGKTISLGAVALVCGRAAFGAVTLGLILVLRRDDTRAAKPTMVALGVLLAVHWVTFFHAVQLSSVAIGLLTFSSFPMFVVLLERIVFRAPIEPREAGLVGVALIGVALVVPTFDLSDTLTVGALWGVVSGLTFALLTVANRRLVRDVSAVRIGLWQNGVAAVVLLPWSYEVLAVARTTDWAQLVLLGVVFTGGAHALFVHGMRSVSATQASLIVTLESVYGVAAAAVLLAEIPTLRTLIGGAIIVGAVVTASVAREGTKRRG